MDFWTPPLLLLGGALLGGLLLMILPPMFVRVADEQLGYLVLLIGGGLLWLALKLHVVEFAAGGFVQQLLSHEREELAVLLRESWLLLLCYFVLSLTAALCRRQIQRLVWAWARRMPIPWVVLLWTLLVGSLGSLSVVVMAVVGAIFFRTLEQITRRDFTPCAVFFAAAIGISALLTTVGEPLGLFIADNLGEGTGYLLRTFGLLALLNVLSLAIASWIVAWRLVPLSETTEEHMLAEVHAAERAVSAGDGREVQEALEAVEEFEREEHDFAHMLDRTLHSSVKLYFFVLGLLFLGEASKPIAVRVFSDVPLSVAFFANAVSAVADNALLGLLEIRRGMPQGAILALGTSLSLWGVALIPGNVCNIILKEHLDIPFRTWARYGIPCALGLAALNLVLVFGVGKWLVL